MDFWKQTQLHLTGMKAKELTKSLKNNNKIKDKTLYTLCMLSELSHQALPRWLGSEESTYNAGYVEFDPGVRRVPGSSGDFRISEKVQCTSDLSYFLGYSLQECGSGNGIHSTQAIQLGLRSVWYQPSSKP